MEWIEELKCFLLGNKIFMEFFSSFFVGIASIIVGIAGIIFSRNQLKISQQQLKIKEQEVQPVIRVVYSLKKGENSEKYKDEYITIINDGKMAQFSDFQIDTFYRIRYSSTSKKIYAKEYYIKVNGFYFYQHITQHSTGELLHGYSANNNAKYARLVSEAIHYSQNGDYYFTEKYSLIKITYDDINNKTHVVYFKDRSPITEEKYKELINKPIIFDFPIDFERVNLQEIIQQIEAMK